MKLLTLSNSCPRWSGGELSPRSPGGLVPMLIALLDRHGGDWVFTAPAEAAGSPDSVSLRGDVRLHPMQVDEELRRHHYDTVSIRLFLGLLHYLHDASEQPVFDSATRAAWAGYETVNRMYAKRLDELAEDSPELHILINDPHLMLVPELYGGCSERRAARLTYFLGTPWCEPDYFTLLPGDIRVRLLESLLQCDVVGFHARRWADAFLRCCERFLPGARVEDRVVVHRGKETELVAVPFPLDIDVLDEMVSEPATAEWAERLDVLAAGRRTMVRADRLDLWKNLPRGFAAYEAMLERRPGLASECWFGAVVTKPSRAAGRHLAYQQATEAAVRRINERFAPPGRDAVSLIYPGSGGDSRNAVIAALRGATAAMVNSTFDGLNLFAKEAAYLLRDDTSLLISANAGVHEQLAPYSLTLDPFDLEQNGQVMEAALDGRPAAHPSAARRRALLRAESSERWLTEVFRR